MMPSSSFSGNAAGPSSLLVEKLVAYLPALILPDPLAGPRSWDGVVLFAETDGFAALAESLAKTGREGGDVLTRVLSSYYSPLLATLARYGGQVLSFDGNGLAAFFEASEAGPLGRAQAAAQALLEANRTFPAVQTLEGRYSPRLRIGLARGELKLTVLGSDILGRSLIFDGPALEQAQHIAAQTAWGELTGPASPTQEVVTLGSEPASAVRFFGDEDPHSVYNRLSPYLPRPLAQRLKATPATAIGGDFRRVVNIYVQLNGVDLNQPEQVAQLQEYYTQVQRVCSGLDGRVYQIVPRPAEDRVCLHLTFGALLSSNDDAEHALRTALALRDLPTPGNELPTIGIASGNVYSGSIGSAQRQNYIVLGKVVGLSAGFAHAAQESYGPGTLLVDRFTRERVGLSFLFGEDKQLDLPESNLPVKTSQLLAARPAALNLAAFLRENPLGTRAASDASDILDNVLSGQREVRLVHDSEGLPLLAQRWLKRSGLGAVGTCLVNATNVPYLAWSGLLAGLIGLNDSDSRTEKAARLSQAVANYAPDFTPLTGWLNQLLGLVQEEPGFRQRISSQQRDQFASLVVSLLRGMAEDKPLLLIFRDLQWSDEAGLDLLEQVISELDGTSALFCLHTRPEASSIEDRLTALPGQPG